MSSFSKTMASTEVAASIQIVKNTNSTTNVSSTKDTSSARNVSSIMNVSSHKNVYSTKNASSTENKSIKNITSTKNAPSIKDAPSTIVKMPSGKTNYDESALKVSTSSISKDKVSTVSNASSDTKGTSPPKSEKKHASTPKSRRSSDSSSGSSSISHTRSASTSVTSWARVASFSDTSSEFPKSIDCTSTKGSNNSDKDDKTKSSAKADRKAVISCNTEDYSSMITKLLSKDRGKILSTKTKRKQLPNGPTAMVTMGGQSMRVPKLVLLAFSESARSKIGLDGSNMKLPVGSMSPSALQYVIDSWKSYCTGKAKYPIPDSPTAMHELQVYQVVVALGATESQWRLKARLMAHISENQRALTVKHLRVCATLPNDDPVKNHLLHSLAYSHWKGAYRTGEVTNFVDAHPDLVDRLVSIEQEMIAKDEARKTEAASRELQRKEAAKARRIELRKEKAMQAKEARINKKKEERKRLHAQRTGYRLQHKALSSDGQRHLNEWEISALMGHPAVAAA